MAWTAALLSGLLATAAHAQEISGFYVGVGPGLFAYDEDNEEAGFLLSDNAVSFRIIGGYQLNDYYAIEVGLGRSSDLEEQLFFPVVVPPDSFDVASVTFGAEIEMKTLRVVAYAPFSRLNMFGSLGYYDAEIERTRSFAFPQGFPEPPFRESFKSSDSGVTVAGGIQYEWDRIALRGEYEWFDTDDIDTGAINVIAVFRF